MENSIWFMLLLQVILIGFNAVFACAEIAVISMNDTKLAKMAEQGDRRAVRLARLTSQPARFLATIQVAITLSGFLGSAFAADNFSDGLVDWLVGLGVKVPASTLDTIAIVLITIILSYFTLIFGELVPKRVAMRKAEALALGMSGLISGIAKLFAPIVWFLTVSTNGILRLMGIDPDADDEEVSEEEIRMMVDVGSEKGAIDPEEKTFIQNVFEFDDLSVDVIATHRTEVALLRLEETMEEWKDTICNSRHTWYPICEGDIDNVTGILDVEDYFRLEDKSRENVMKSAVTPVYFVPEKIKADVLFRNMKRDHSHFAVLLDEYGGMSGIVTMSDLIEQLVGDIGSGQAEDDDTADIEQIGDNTWKIRGSASLNDVSAALGITLSSKEYGTFSGLIFSALGMVPCDGSNVELEAEGLKIRITEIQDHRIESTLVSKIPSAQERP